MPAKHRNKYENKNGICLRCERKQEYRVTPCPYCKGLVVTQRFKEETEERKLIQFFWTK